MFISGRQKLFMIPIGKLKKTAIDKKKQSFDYLN